MQFIGAQPTVDLTNSDVFLVPSHSEVGSRLGVDLAPADGTPATLPLVAANMNAVTGPRLAAVLARRGGLGVLPQDMNTEQLVDAIRWVKRQPVNCDTPLLLPPHATVADALRLVPLAQGYGVVVADIEDPAALSGSIIGTAGLRRDFSVELPEWRQGLAGVMDELAGSSRHPLPEGTYQAPFPTG